MITTKDNLVFVNKKTTRLDGFRLEDTARAPVIILFIDNDKPELIAVSADKEIPVKVKSLNMETEIQIISYAEIDQYLHNRK